MALKKNVPLKDEELSLSDNIDERFDSIDNDLAEIKSTKADITLLQTQVTKLPDDVCAKMEVMLDKRNERMRQQDIDEGRISTNECIDELNKTVCIFNDGHEKAIGIIKLIGNYLENIDKYIRGNISETPQVSTVLEKIDTVGTLDTATPSFPSIPPKDGKWSKLLCYDIPTYTLTRIKHSKTVRQLFTLITLLIALIITFLLIFVARENAYLRQENAWLRQTEAKYYLLRKASRSHKEWSKSADYIEFLYTDPEQNRDIIQRLRQKP
jgi:hypothetical protein